LTVIVVNYDGWPDVLSLLSRLEEEPEFLSGACQVVVVDNASLGPPPECRALRRPGLQLVLRPDNGGFAVGVNAGWRLSRSRWLLLLNPDVDVEPGTIGRIFDRIDALDARPEGPPGIVGFGLRNADGSSQGSVGVFPSLARTVREQFLPRSRRKYRSESRVRPGPVDWVTGACMLVNTRVMTEVGGFDEDFFLYHEEVALCRTARNRGWRVEYDPTVSVIHRHPLQNRPVSPKMRVVIRHSKLLYFQKHTPRWQFLALAWAVEMEAAARGTWAALGGRTVERKAWRTIGRIAQRLRRGRGPRGRRVLALAEEAERGPKEPAPPAESNARIAGSRPFGRGVPRRDGRASASRDRG
jgi:N-acetylglucosaminyl-diphospho-decaprenol L-rhamnosyltransferase